VTVDELVFTGTSTLELELGAANSFDRIAVAGRVSIAPGANLALQLAFDPVDFVDSFQIIENDDTDLIPVFPSGFAFAGKPLAEGDTFTAGSQEFRITYVGGTGNDVVLHAVPEGNGAFLAAALSLVAGRRWRRLSFAADC
jgi:hypothetical protein